MGVTAPEVYVGGVAAVTGLATRRAWDSRAMQVPCPAGWFAELMAYLATTYDPQRDAEAPVAACLPRTPAEVGSKLLGTSPTEVSLSAQAMASVGISQACCAIWCFM